MTKKPMIVVQAVLLLALLVMIGFRVFYMLEEIGLDDEDEAWHVTNAYEMYQNDRWLINTFHDKVDYYNNKPPLGLCVMVATFHLLGVSLFTAKLPSALFGVLICILLAVFLFRRESLLHAMLFAAAYFSMDLLYDYHMFRSGNFDAMFALLFMLGLLCLYYARDCTRWFLPFGFCCALAFLTRSFHAASLMVVGLCCLPLSAKKDRIKNTLLAILLMIAVIAPWAVKRYMFDGTAFFHAMFFTEVVGMLRKSTFFLVTELSKQILFRLLFLSCILFIVITTVRKKSLTEGLKAFAQFAKNYAVFWLGLLVPVVLYSIAGTASIWYVYPSIICAAVLTAVYAGALLTDMPLLPALVLLGAFLICCTFTGILRIREYQGKANGGSEGLQYWSDLKEIKAKYGNTYDGEDIYVQNMSRNYESNEVDFFYDDMSCYSELVCDFHCKDGGVEAWLSAPDGILVLHKDLWDKYSDVLYGHVIINDNGFLYFTHDFW